MGTSQQDYGHVAGGKGNFHESGGLAWIDHNMFESFDNLNSCLYNTARSALAEFAGVLFCNWSHNNFIQLPRSSACTEAKVFTGRRSSAEKAVK